MSYDFEIPMNQYGNISEFIYIICRFYYFTKKYQSNKQTVSKYHDAREKSTWILLLNNLEFIQNKITPETLNEFKDRITPEILNTYTKKKKVEYVSKWCRVFINYYGKCLFDISSFIVKLLQNNLMLMMDGRFNLEQIDDMINSVLFNPMAKLQIKKELKDQITKIRFATPYMNNIIYVNIKIKDIEGLRKRFYDIYTHIEKKKYPLRYSDGDMYRDIYKYEQAKLDEIKEDENLYKMTKNAQITTNGRKCIKPCIKNMGMCTCKIEPYTKNGIKWNWDYCTDC